MWQGYTRVISKILSLFFLCVVFLYFPCLCYCLWGNNEFNLIFFSSSTLGRRNGSEKNERWRERKSMGNWYSQWRSKAWILSPSRTLHWLVCACALKHNTAPSWCEKKKTSPSITLFSSPLLPRCHPYLFFFFFIPIQRQHKITQRMEKKERFKIFFLCALSARSCFPFFLSNFLHFFYFFFSFSFLFIVSCYGNWNFSPDKSPLPIYFRPALPKCVYT